jgi:putative salt-induced outer membrane protein
MRTFGVLFGATALFLASAAGAQTLQNGSGGTAAGGTTSGKTDVVKEGFQKQADDKEEERKKGVTELAFNLGGLFTAGNSRSAALTAGVKSRVRRGDHQLTLGVAANYARAGKVGFGTETTVQNLQGAARYDFFILKPFSVFGQLTGRHDRFQGLDLRLNVDVGVAYFFIQQEKVRLWGEAGYDFQYDIRRDEALVDAKGAPKLGRDGNPVEKTNAVHNARLFVGFDHKLFEGVQFVTSLEYLQDVTDFATPTLRLIYDGAVKASLSKSFALSTGITVRYEANPLPGIERTDVLTGVSLVYNLL